MGVSVRTLSDLKNELINQTKTIGKETGVSDEDLEEALDIFNTSWDSCKHVILELVQPIIDGYENEYGEDEILKNWQEVIK